MYKWDLGITLHWKTNCLKSIFKKAIKYYNNLIPNESEHLYKGKNHLTYFPMSKIIVNN